MAGVGRRCHCLFPALIFPGDCSKCGLTHYGADRMRIQAAQIPYPFYACGKISWQQLENLREQIDCLVERVYSDFRSGILGEWSVLYYYQESILAEVKNLLLNQHDITLEREDEQRFKIINV